jgi:NAD(P)-dependent dehydrogenase (short-subunit alcohol dehydrogenase family)
MAERTALVTGGNRGIGLEVCRQLKKLGHRVVLTARDADHGAKEAAKLGVEFEHLDAASIKSIAACAKRRPDVDVLVNNAGIYPSGGVLAADEKDLREAMEINYWGPLWSCRAFVPGMLARGYGRVVNVTSGYGLFSEGLEGPAPYCLSKAALDALTFKLAKEVKGDLKVNAVCPGWVRTRMGGSGASRPVEKGAETIVWAATLPASGPSGKIFRDKRELGW